MEDKSSELEQKRLRLNLIEKSKGKNWGQKKGGLLSKGSLKSITFPEKCKELAEFVGIILGDGNIYSHSKGKKIGVYSVRIAGDYKKDKDYHLNYIQPLCVKPFEIKVRVRNHVINNERFICLDSKQLIKYLMSIGLKSGDKIKNNLGIPTWIFKNKEFLKACLRGLIDTDGSVFRMSQRDSGLIRIGFTNHNTRLLDDTRAAFVKLGFYPSKIIGNKKIFISRQSDIARYIKEIGFSNSKHKDRFKEFNSPVL